MNKEQVIAKVYEYTDRLNKMFGTKVAYPTVEFRDLGSSKAGVANIRAHKIAFHPFYMDQEHFQNETIPHEVVHLFVPVIYPSYKQFHGPEFRRLMNMLGCEGKTYHNMGKAETTTRTRQTKSYEYVCNCPGVVMEISSIRHGKMQRGAVYKCRRCATKIRMK